MPTKRTRVPRNPLTRVTPEALTAWLTGDRKALHLALRLKPWEHNPLDTFGESDTPSVRPAWLSQTRWDTAMAWRKALEEVAARGEGFQRNHNP